MSPLHCTDHSLVSAAELFYLSFASRKAHSFWWFPHRIIQTHLKSKKVNFPSICLLGVPVCWSPWLLCACLCLSLSFYLFISLSSHLSLFGRNCRGRKFIFVFCCLCLGFCYSASLFLSLKHFTFVKNNYASWLIIQHIAGVVIFNNQYISTITHSIKRCLSKAWMKAKQFSKPFITFCLFITCLLGF